MNFESLKKGLKVTVLILFGIVLLIIIIASSIFGFQAYDEYKKKERDEKFVNQLADSVFYFQFTSYKIKGIFKLKINTETNVFSYLCNAKAIDDFYFSNEEGKLTIMLHDNDGFLIDEFSPQSYISIVNENDLTISKEAVGEWNVDIEDILKANSVRVAHTFTLKELPKAKPQRQKNLSQFESELEKWTQKVKKIKIGMTYDEMVSAAGEPRTRANTLYDYQDDYDYYKYNYGKKWIYFKNELVFQIR